MSIKVKGAQHLEKQLEKLEKQGAKRALRKATRAGTTVLLKAVRSATPVDVLTGVGFGVRPADDRQRHVAVPGLAFDSPVHRYS